MTRPARSSSAPRRARRSTAPSGDACTPAAHSTVCAAIRSLAVAARATRAPCAGSTSVTVAARQHRHAQPLQLGRRLRRQLGRVGRQDAVRRLDEQDRGRRAGRCGGSRAAQRVVGDLGDGAGQLDAGRPAADDDERQPARARRSGRSRARPPRRPAARGGASSVASSIVFSPGASRSHSSWPK